MRTNPRLRTTAQRGRPRPSRKSCVASSATSPAGPTTPSARISPTSTPEAPNRPPPSTAVPSPSASLDDELDIYRNVSGEPTGSVLRGGLRKRPSPSVTCGRFVGPWSRTAALAWTSASVQQLVRERAAAFPRWLYATASRAGPSATSDDGNPRAAPAVRLFTGQCLWRLVPPPLSSENPLLPPD
jgi:hypothetical protein